MSVHKPVLVQLELLGQVLWVCLHDIEQHFDVLVTVLDQVRLSVHDVELFFVKFRTIQLSSINFLDGFI